MLLSLIFGITMFLFVLAKTLRLPNHLFQVSSVVSRYVTISILSQFVFLR